MNAMRLPNWSLVWGSLLVACGDSSETTDTVITRPPDAIFGEIGFDVDTSVSVTVPPDFGDACAENTDCSTGLCIEGGSGSVCSKNCVEICPDGWDCRGVRLGSPDIIFVCVPSGIIEPLDARDSSDGSGGETTDTADAGDTGGTQITTDIGTGTGTGPDTDTTEPPLSGNACLEDLGPGDDTLFDEASASGGADFPDCVTGCDHAGQTGLWEIDLRSSVWTGASGGLDEEVHEYNFDGGSGNGPDIDIIAIRAEPRTMIEFAVQKNSAAGALDPVVYVSDGFQVRTYNSDVSPTNTCARSVIAYPYVGPLPIFVAIEDATNYERYTPDGYLPGTVGGANYGYTLRIRTGGFAPHELGSLASPSTTNVTNHEIVAGGDIRYYRFYAKGTLKPAIVVTRTAGANAAFVPAVAGMKTVGGELVWQRADFDSDGNGSVTMNAATAFRPCIPPAECPSGFSCPGPVCTDAEAEFVFAVFDWNGAADPGAFSYDVRVVLP